MTHHLLTINPAAGEEIARDEPHDSDTVEAAIRLAELMADEMGKPIGAGRSALEIEHMFAAGGAPDGLFVTLLIPSSQVDPVISHSLVRASVASTAGSHAKPATENADTTVFGLGAAIFTADLELGEHIAAHRLRAGSCAVNTPVACDLRLPFGGIGESGDGRELSRHGITAFVYVKTVVAS